MGRKSTQNLIKNIVECLKKGPKSISEISRETELDRMSISRYLKVLKESRFLVEEEQNNKKIYSLVKTFRTDTYFGLPLDEETDKQIDSIYYTIKKIWREKNNTPLLKTTAQKIMYGVIKDSKKQEIPHGWYIYGGVCVKPYDPTKQYSKTELSQKLIIDIKNNVQTYSNKHAYENKLLQYKAADKELYKIKERIFQILYSQNFSKKSMRSFLEQYVKLILNTPLEEPIIQIVESYHSLLLDLTKNWDVTVPSTDSNDYPKFKQKLISSFEVLWKLIALINFKKDLEAGKYYPKTLLNEYFKLEIEHAKNEVIEISSEINNLFPLEEEPENIKYKDIKDALKKLNS